jgi:hypothetical protein
VSFEWFRPTSDGLFGQWHMRAGETAAGLILAACDQTFRGDELLEARPVATISADERCNVCQGVRAAAEQNAA